jgi:hypothetical protein
MIAAPHPRFPMQGHILSIGGDALSKKKHLSCALESGTQYHKTSWD